jgi:hypothetical protein
MGAWLRLPAVLPATDSTQHNMQVEQHTGQKDGDPEAAV